MAAVIRLSSRSNPEWDLAPRALSTDAVEGSRHAPILFRVQEFNVISIHDQSTDRDNFPPGETSTRTGTLSNSIGHEDIRHS